VTKWELARGVRGGQRGFEEQPQVGLGTYYVQNRRLYYVLDMDDDANFLVEDCITLGRAWHTPEEIWQENVMIVGRG